MALLPLGALEFEAGSLRLRVFVGDWTLEGVAGPRYHLHETGSGDAKASPEPVFFRDGEGVSRTAIDRDDWPRVALLGMTWVAIPLSLFPIAQQWIDSSVAGMINGAVPITTALWSTVLLRRLPGRIQLLGIALGFAGVVAVLRRLGAAARGPHQVLPRVYGPVETVGRCPG